MGKKSDAWKLERDAHLRQDFARCSPIELHSSNALVFDLPAR